MLQEVCVPRKKIKKEIDYTAIKQKMLTQCSFILCALVASSVYGITDADYSPSQSLKANQTRQGKCKPLVTQWSNFTFKSILQETKRIRQ